MSLKICVIIPDRNDRPAFLNNCLRMLRNQTVQPNMVEVMNEPTIFLPHEKDITWRYRIAYEKMFDKGLDCILFMENDDYYAPDFIETILAEWVKAGKPNLFGPNYTWYYNIAHRKCIKLDHLRRSTMAQTLIKPDMDFKWCADQDPYTDSWLWSRLPKLNGVTFTPSKEIFIGIKHGIGLVGGEFHTTKIDYYDKHGFVDTDLKWLEANMDAESFKFYSNIL